MTLLTLLVALLGTTLWLIVAAFIVMPTRPWRNAPTHNGHPRLND